MSFNLDTLDHQNRAPDLTIIRSMINPIYQEVYLAANVNASYNINDKVKYKIYLERRWQI